MHGFSELDYEGRIFFKASNALVRLVIMSLSADDASYRCYSDPPISCMDLDKWNPESPLVNFFLCQGLGTPQYRLALSLSTFDMWPLSFATP